MSCKANPPTAHHNALEPYRHRTDTWTPGTRRRRSCRSPCEAPGVPALRAPRGRPGVLPHRWGSARPRTIRPGSAAPTASRSSAENSWPNDVNKEAIKTTKPIENQIGSSLLFESRYLRRYPSQRHQISSPHPNCLCVCLFAGLWGDPAPMAVWLRG